MDINEEKFQIRAYGFGELAQMYLPDIKPKSASARLKAWIEFNKPLSKAMENVGHTKGSRVLTPKMVKILIEFLGEPN